MRAHPKAVEGHGTLYEVASRGGLGGLLLVPRPGRPAVRALLGHRSALERRPRVARVGRVPAGVARCERRCRQAVKKDREADREEDRVQQHRLVHEIGILDEEHREDDRRQSARPEPAEEGDGRSPRAGPEHRQATGIMRTMVRLSSA